MLDTLRQMQLIRVSRMTSNFSFVSDQEHHAAVIEKVRAAGDVGYFPSDDEKALCESALGAGIFETRSGINGGYFLSQSQLDLDQLLADPLFDVNRHQRD